MPLLFPEDLRVAACTSIMQFSAGQQAQPESNVHSKLAVVIRSTAQLLQAFSSETWKHSAIRVLVHTSAEKTHHAQCTGACQRQLGFLRGHFCVEQRRHQCERVTEMLP